MLQSKEIFTLSIESSCDDTSAAVLCNDRVLSNIVAGQKVHELYGGVVPELASRAHQQHIVVVVDAALKQAGVSRDQLSCVAYTNGPGLLGSLLVGTSFAKAMSLGLAIPLVEVNHMQAHVAAHYIDNKPSFPFLCLTVSGGHTQIVLVRDHLEMQIVGQTLDDAVGEAFDKAAKVMRLPYPGGPLVDKYAAGGDPLKYRFPEPALIGFNYSFSGVKTAFLHFITKQVQTDNEFLQKEMKDICASYQEHLVHYLLKVFLLAAEKEGVRELAIAGGVSANSRLRRAMEDLKTKGFKTHIPKFEYCTDNAAMIGITGYFKYLKGEFADIGTPPFARSGTNFI
jgi:N6-L-threonylcarbamoyladenine synthase